MRKEMKQMKGRVGGSSETSGGSIKEKSCAQEVGKISRGGLRFQRCNEKKTDN